MVCSSFAIILLHTYKCIGGIILKFEHTEVWGFEHALRGMRNPKNSWDKSDSVNCAKCTTGSCMYIKPFHHCFGGKDFIIGKNDMKLVQTLIRAGSEHRKFMRQIFVSVDITAPLYWWKEFDTYKVGTVANSTSTMHKLTSQPITMNCFEMDDYHTAVCDISTCWGRLIETLEKLRYVYVKTKDKRVWKELIRLLPESWLQTRTITMNYENIYSMVKQRKNHKLNEWSGNDYPSFSNFISWAKSLPYSQELIFIDKIEDKNNE